MFFSNIKLIAGLAIIPAVLMCLYYGYHTYKTMEETIKEQTTKIEMLKKDCVIKDANISALENSIQSQNKEIERFKAESLKKEQEMTIINQELIKKQEELDSYQYIESGLSSAEENMKWLLEKSKSFH